MSLSQGGMVGKGHVDFLDIQITLRVAEVKLKPFNRILDLSLHG